MHRIYAKRPWIRTCFGASLRTTFRVLGRWRFGRRRALVRAKWEDSLDRVREDPNWYSTGRDDRGLAPTTGPGG
jgi:hypothetical protein